MTKDQALDLISELKGEVTEKFSEEKYNVQEQFWNDKVYAYTGAIFGNKDESIALHMFAYYYEVHPNVKETLRNRDYDNWSQVEIDFRIERLEAMLESFKKMVESGVYKRKNRFDGYTDPEINREILSDYRNLIIIGITILTIVISGFYYLGFVVGSLESTPKTCSSESCPNLSNNNNNQHCYKSTKETIKDSEKETREDSVKQEHSQRTNTPDSSVTTKK
tara:strand:- start:371 stop:1033 length:663 start_codon:yes stop_codon:yes gene_type:complete